MNFSTFLCISLYFSAFLWISLNFFSFLYISLCFSAFYIYIFDNLVEHTVVLWTPFLWLHLTFIIQNVPCGKTSLKLHNISSAAVPGILFLTRYPEHCARYIYFGLSWSYLCSPGYPVSNQKYQNCFLKLLTLVEVLMLVSK